MMKVSGIELQRKFPAMKNSLIITAAAISSFNASSMALLPQNFAFPSPISRHRCPSRCASKASFFLYSSSSFRLSFSSISRLSATPIFLPFLEEAEEEEEDEEVGSDEEEELSNDPLIRFFKSRSQIQDPQREGKPSLQKNRRSSWHLSASAEFHDRNESGPDEELGVEEKTRTTVDGSSDSVSSAEGIVGDIVRIARNLPENTTLGEVLGDYEGRISEKDCVEVLNLLGEAGLLVCCLYFFEWMRNQEPTLVSPRACSILFPLLGRAAMGDVLMVLFRNLPVKEELMDVHVYNAAISGLMSCKRFEDAYEVYEIMETNNIRPDHVTCSIMITMMRKTGRSAKEAWDYFEKMNKKGVKSSPEVFGAIIKSFCEEGLKSQALIIQLEMNKKGIPSNAIVFNTLMDAFNKSNQIEEVEGLFSEMKDKGIKPTTATFHILMSAYSSRMQPEIVERLLVEMEEMGLEPNVKSYTCLISAYGRLKKTSDLAANAFLRMKKRGIKPTSHSYTALIHAYSLGGWHEKALIAFENMKIERLKPSMETYTALLDAFRRAGDAETLMKIWKMMLEEKIKGSRVTFNILVDGFAKQGLYAEARDAIHEFSKIGEIPTVMTYNMLINAYARGGQHSKMPQLLKEMENLNLKPDSVTYSTMIYAYIRVRDFKRAFFYHKTMVKSGQVPDAGSYRKLREILDVKAAKKNKKDKSAILGIINSKMGLVKAKKGKKDEFWKNKKKHYRTDRISPRG